MNESNDFIDFCHVDSESPSGLSLSPIEPDDMVDLIYHYTYRVECQDHKVNNEPRSCVGIIIWPSQSESGHFKEILIGYVEKKGTSKPAYYNAERKKLKFYLTESSYIPIVIALSQKKPLRVKLRPEGNPEDLYWAIIEFWDTID